METLVVLAIGTAMTLGCFALGFGIFVIKAETPSVARVRNSSDAESL